ncbi:hypothetical protein GCM10020254_76910 [Streptomyces goshikiensis]
MLVPYWWVQNHGTGVWTVGTPSMLRATAAPWSWALVQCSTRQLPPSARAGPAGHVARRVDPGDGGLPERVHDDAVVHLEPGAFGEVRVGGPCRRRRPPYAPTGRRPGVGGDHEVALPLEAFEADAGADVDAAGAVQSGDGVGDRCGQHAPQGVRLGLRDGDLAAHPAGGGGDFEADEAGADDEDGAAVDQRGPQVARVGEGAQPVDPGEPFRPGEVAGAAAGGEEEPVVAERAAVVEDEGALGGA